MAVSKTLGLFPAQPQTWPKLDWQRERERTILSLGRKQTLGLLRSLPVPQSRVGGPGNLR